jgi:two-component system sensor kinase FixL
MRAGQIIRRLREFVAKGEADRRVEPLRKLIEEAAALALVGAKPLGVQVRLDIAHAPDRVLADKVQIQQVLLNLIRNGMEAMSESTRRELAISARGLNQSAVEISVADTGPGVAPEIAERLFQPFLTTKAQGMGVGLSICRTIVEAHGGRIWVTETPGGGATFHFTLPQVGQESGDD